MVHKCDDGSMLVSMNAKDSNLYTEPTEQEKKDNKKKWFMNLVNEFHEKEFDVESIQVDYKIEPSTNIYSERYSIVIRTDQPDRE